MRRMRLVLLGVILIALVGAPSAMAAPVPYLGTIVFESERLGPIDLFIMRPDGSGQTHLNTPGGGADGSWSPDGRRIAFSSDPEGDGNVDIFVMNVDGSGLAQLTDEPGLDIWPDWFRGGKQLVFASDRSGLPQIYVMNADGSGVVQLTDEPDAVSLTPAVSPSGREIVFTRATEFEPPKVWVMNADGTGQQQITGPGPWQDIDPQWSPDGRDIVFSSNRVGSFEIFLMNADGSEVTALTAEPGFDLSPTFSPDGRYIAWTASRAGNPDVWVMRRDGSDKTRLTDAPGFDGFPDWHMTRVLR